MNGQNDNTCGNNFPSLKLISYSSSSSSPRSSSILEYRTNINITPIAYSQQSIKCIVKKLKMQMQLFLSSLFNAHIHLLLPWLKGFKHNVPIPSKVRNWAREELPILLHHVVVCDVFCHEAIEKYKNLLLYLVREENKNSSG